MFEILLKDAGLSTTETEIDADFRTSIVAAGSAINNDSAHSPFYRLLFAVVKTPVLQIISTLMTAVLPNFYLKTATGEWLVLLADSYGLSREQPQKAQGNITFSRVLTAGELIIPAGVVIASVGIEGTTYKLTSTTETRIPDGDSSVLVFCEAQATGEAYNLGVGAYNILEIPVNGITSASNESGWITRLGTDLESDEALRIRCRNRWNVLSDWHTDSAYVAILSGFDGVDPHHIFFDHNNPRGAGSADIYILLDVGEVSQGLLDQINDYIMVQGHHGHGDDLDVKAMIAKPFDLSLILDFVLNISLARQAEILADAENLIRAIFRENSAYSTLERVAPHARYAKSKISKHLHEQFPELEAVNWLLPADDLFSSLEVPTIQSLIIATS